MFSPTKPGSEEHQDQALNNKRLINMIYGRLYNCNGHENGAFKIEPQPIKAESDSPQSGFALSGSDPRICLEQNSKSNKDDADEGSNCANSS